MDMKTNCLKQGGKAELKAFSWAGQRGAAYVKNFSREGMTPPDGV